MRMLLQHKKVLRTPVKLVRGIDDSFTLVFVNSRIEGVSPLRSVASYLIYADVRTFQCLIIMPGTEQQYHTMVLVPYKTGKTAQH